MSRYIPPPRNRMDTTPRTPSEPLAEPLIIRLTQDVGLLPAGYLFEIPAYEAYRLIARRKAVPVGQVGVMTDLSLSPEECDEAGIF